MKLKHLWGTILVIVLLAGLPHPVASQATGEIELTDLLPGQTLLYIEWRGLDHEHVKALRDTNPLLRLFNSPEWPANWEAVRRYEEQVEEIERRQSRQDGTQPESRDDDTDDVSWEEARSRIGKRVAVALVPLFSAPEADPQVTGVLIADTGGDQKLIERFWRPQKGEDVEEKRHEVDGIIILETIRTIPSPKRPAISEEEGLNGVEAEPAEPKVKRSYRALAGNLGVYSDSKELVELIVRNTRSTPAESLSDTESYRQSRTGLGGASLFELFIDVGRLAVAATSEAAREGDLPVSPDEALRAFGVGNVETMTASISLDSLRARFNASLLMKPAEPDTRLFLGPPVGDFASLSFAPPDALGYSVMQFDVGAVWASIEEVLLTGLPPELAPMVMSMKGATEGMMGMAFQKMADSWGHEFAQITAAAQEEADTESVHALSLRDADALITAVRNLLGTFGAGSGIIEAGGDDDQVSFVYLSGGSAEQEPEASAAAAFGRDWLMLGKSEKAIARFQANVSSHKTLRENPDFQRVRATMPDLLVGLSYLDLGRVVSSGVADKVLAEILQDAVVRRAMSATKPATAEGDEGTGEDAEAPPAEMELPEPPTLRFPKGMLTLLYSFTHRDARGIHFRGTLE